MKSISQIIADTGASYYAVRREVADLNLTKHRAIHLKGGGWHFEYDEADCIKLYARLRQKKPKQNQYTKVEIVGKKRMTPGAQSFLCPDWRDTL